MALDVKEAVRKAIHYLSELLDKENIPNLLLEEVELTDDEEYWLVTLSYTQPELTDEPLDLLKPSKIKRIYKQLKISKFGDVKFLKNVKS